MSSEVTPDLIALALQKLESIQANESEPISDDECRRRAEEVAEAALRAIAVCVKYLLSKNAEARINGLGSFHLEEHEIRFVPESDVIQYTLLKQREGDQVQLSLRNAFVATLLTAKGLIPLLEEHSDEPATTSMPLADDLVEKIYGTSVPNNFAAVIASLFEDIIGELNEAGFEIKLETLTSVESVVARGQRAAELAESARDLANQGRERVRSAISATRGQWESRIRNDAEEESAG